MQYERQMRIPSWNILMRAHSNCVGDEGAYLNLQLNPQEEDGGMILFCVHCGDEICSVRNG